MDENAEGAAVSPCSSTTEVAGRINEGWNVRVMVDTADTAVVDGSALLEFQVDTAQHTHKHEAAAKLHPQPVSKQAQASARTRKTHLATRNRSCWWTQCRRASLPRHGSSA